MHPIGIGAQPIEVGAVLPVSPRLPRRPPLKSFYFQPPALPSNFDGHRLSPQHRPIPPGKRPVEGLPGFVREEHPHARRHPARPAGGAFRPGRGLRLRLRKAVTAMFDLILGAAVSVGLTLYLVYVLIRPERF
ncbi:K(+)-transporting ATPase subunit F [Nitrospirillum viridazoti CBAmc]|uniref:K(+)-transporting ATPase subunit F n=1 Tax=Nitrospirillum viridazoti CBAmc TaxID=1441467 RepID=A0A248JQP3_9PROT|nr:K(+)-transporting ATPase subunit F [Nitrospirillum amazonense CBAmc]